MALSAAITLCSCGQADGQRAELDRLGLPVPGAAYLGDTISGSDSCIDACTSVYRWFKVNSTVEEVISSLSHGLAGKGYAVQDPTRWHCFVGGGSSGPQAECVVWGTSSQWKLAIDLVVPSVDVSRYQPGQNLPTSLGPALGATITTVLMSVSRTASNG